MTDFSTWDRKTLEDFARTAADDNKALRDDLKAAMLGWRLAVLDAQKPAPATQPTEATWLTQTK